MNKDNVKLSGNGSATVLKRMWDSSETEGIITVTATNGGCCIENLFVDGNKANFSEFNNHGISLISSSNNTVTGNTCNDNQRGIYLSNSDTNTITGNTCNGNSYGIYLISSDTNTVTGNTCIRGTGQSSDYTTSQYTIRIGGSSNNYNLIAYNNIMGKDVVINGGTNNTSAGNKYS